MATLPETSMRLTAEQLNLIDEALTYYAMCDYGGGTHDNPQDKATYRAIDLRITNARRKLGEVVD